MGILVARRLCECGASEGRCSLAQWEAVCSIAAKFGCTAETLRPWVRQAERDNGARPGMTGDERDRIRALEREVRALGQANEILRKASAYFAQAAPDRPFKR